MIRVFNQKLICLLLLLAILISTLSLAGCGDEAVSRSDDIYASAETEAADAVDFAGSIATPTPTAVPVEEQNAEICSKIVELALSFEGGKYSYSGFSPETGFDCSGLLYYVFRQYGYRISRVASDQAKNGQHVDKEDLIPGDIVTFHVKGSNYIGHCGLYIGDGYFIHAMDSAHGIVVTSLDEWLETRTLEARRIVGVLTRYSDEEMAQLDEYDQLVADELEKAAQEAAAQEALLKKQSLTQPEGDADSTVIQDDPNSPVIFNTPTPTAAPTSEPEPTVEPTTEPTPQPTVEPTAVPTETPVEENELSSSGEELGSSK